MGKRYLSCIPLCIISFEEHVVGYLIIG